jgi:hypothetical protein
VSEGVRVVRVGEWLQLGSEGQRPGILSRV